MPIPYDKAKAAAAPKAKAKAQVAAKLGDKPQGRVARFSFNECLSSGAGQPGTRISILRRPNFSSSDLAKAKRDVTATPMQPKNQQFKPTRSDSDGNVIFPDDVTLEQEEEWARMKALRLREELEPDTEEGNFFDSSTVRKVYSLGPLHQLLLRIRKENRENLIRLLQHLLRLL